MFQSSRKTMKWSSLLKDIKERVGLSTSPSTSPHSPSSATGSAADGERAGSASQDGIRSLSETAPPVRDGHDMELDFKRYWEEFRTSSSEKEKEISLNMAVDLFCRLVKLQNNAIRLVEAHIFSFVVGRAFVTDVEKLRICSPSKSLRAVNILDFFSKDGISPGWNLLFAVETLVSGPMDKQPLLDSGVLCCLIRILSALLNLVDQSQDRTMESSELPDSSVSDNDRNPAFMHQLEVEGIVVHIMKALASHPSAAAGLIEDDSLQLLFHMVATGSLTAFTRFREGLVPLHTIQLHRHAMQILGLLLVNDNGSTAKYIQKHHLIKVLLMAVKDFDPVTGDSAYTMGIVDLLLECVELSCRPEAGSTRLKVDIHNAHGYQFLVQFALKLSSLKQNQSSQSAHPEPSSIHERKDSVKWGNTSPRELSPSLSRLLDVLVNLSQTGPPEHAAADTGIGSMLSFGKIGGHNRSRTPSSDRVGDELWEKSNAKVRDLEAIQMLQDIFLKAENVDLQAEVLNRMFKIFSSHLENYKLCQQLRTMPLFILNMTGFPSSLQESILKILEYAVTVVNCIPEQELLSLCCLLQQPISGGLKRTILSFFVKLVSFDQQYKKILREVGVLEVLMDDLKEHNFVSGVEHQRRGSVSLERKPSSENFIKHLDNKDAILSSPKIIFSNSGRFHVFEDESTVAVAWDCLATLLKKVEANQSLFRSLNGFTTALTFLASEIHRSGALRLLSSLIIEDTMQTHNEELGAIIDILKSGIVTNSLGTQYKLQTDATCDIFGLLWRVLVSNSAAQRVFGEVTGFSLLLTTLHSFQSDNDDSESFQSSLAAHMKVSSFLFRAVTAGVVNNATNRIRLHIIMSSQTFYDLLCESGLLCVDMEKQMIQLLLEVALETVLPPSSSLSGDKGSTLTSDEGQHVNFLSLESNTSTSSFRVYNASAVGVLLRALLIFTPKVQLELLAFIEKLAIAGSFNQENLTSIGCIGILLEKVSPFIMGTPSPLLTRALRIIELLGAYRISTLELREILRYILQTKSTDSGHCLVKMMERLIQVDDTMSDNAPISSYLEMDMSRTGYGSVQVSLGERTWPPAAGYSFVCWFQYQIRASAEEQRYSLITTTGLRPAFSRQQSGGFILRLFSVGAVDDANTFYSELVVRENGMLTLSTSSSSTLSFDDVRLEEGKWHHLAVVHSKPNSLAGLFQPSTAYLFVDGSLRHTGRLGYSLSPLGRPLQVVIGTPASHVRVDNFSWRFRSCYLFEEVLTPGSIYFMYILGRGYRGIFQDVDLLQFVPDQACSGENMYIMDSLDADVAVASTGQKYDAIGKQGSGKVNRSGVTWDIERLGTFSSQLSGRKLIFAFDGTSSEASKVSGMRSLLNLVDPMSSAASPIGGIPRYGRLHGNCYVCQQCVIGESIRTLGGIPVILALIEASETREMLHMSLSLLSCALHQNPQNVEDMQMYRGYHLLAIFLHRRMPLFDMQSLDIFFRIAACEAILPEAQKLPTNRAFSAPNISTSPDTSLDYFSSLKFSDDVSSTGSQGDLDDISVQKDSFGRLSELESSELEGGDSSNCVVLSNADMVEHVLLDWTLWVTAPVPIQLALLGFLERMVSMHWYRNHNLTILRRINLVQHLLVTLQRGDVDVHVLEKLVVLLGVILEDGFLASELEIVVRFVIMTFDPPQLGSRLQITREAMGKHVIVRNMLLEMLIELQETIKSEELLEQWHKNVSSKLITYFLDEAVHPTSMRWIVTLLGVCLASSQNFSLKFRSSGGYQGLTRVLPSFFDSPEIYYILFCLVFGKSVYPRLPEVRMGDFHSLMPGDGSYVELKFVDLLDSVICMAKSTFDRLSFQSILAQKRGSTSNIEILVAGLGEIENDNAVDLHAEALKHKTSARLMGGEASAPAAATSVLRFMVDLAKMCPPFSTACRRLEFLESCIELYFSCVRADSALKMVKDIFRTSDDGPFNDSEDCNNGFFNFSHEEKSSNSTGQRQSSPGVPNDAPDEHLAEIPKSSADIEKIPSPSVASHQDSSFHDSSVGTDHTPFKDSLSSLSVPNLDSPLSPERTSSKAALAPSSTVLALTSWLGSKGSQTDPKAHPLGSGALSMASSASGTEFDLLLDQRVNSPGKSMPALAILINPKLLLDADDSGYGGGACSASAAAVLDFIGIVLADIVSEHIKGSQYVETILETVPSSADADTALVFQGLCLSRVMNSLERRLIRDDEEDEKKLDKSRWSVNLDSLCSMIVDRVYMGGFPRPSGVLRTLEFLLSMLQLANKDGRIEDAMPAGNVLLSITRGTRQLEAYMQALLKSTNRMIMFFFLPWFLASIQEDELLSRLGLQSEAKSCNALVTGYASGDDADIDICTILKLLIAHKRLMFCPSNIDTDLMCCLCKNLICLLQDQRQNVRNFAAEIMRHLLSHRLQAMEDLLVSKAHQGPQNMDLVRGGFDQLLVKGGTSQFFDWFQDSKQTISNVLDQCASIMWTQYVAGASKFPGIRVKGMDTRRKKELGKKLRDNSKLESRHWEQINERRYALDLVREAMSTELRVIRQDKYGWVLHAESEWQTHLLQLVHERGIFPIQISSSEPEWQLCPIEGPYRMRKKLERCKHKLEEIQSLLSSGLRTEQRNRVKETFVGELGTSESDSEPFSYLDNDGLSGRADPRTDDSRYNNDDESLLFKEPDHEMGWNDDQVSSSTTDVGPRSSFHSIQMADSLASRSDVASPRHSSVKPGERNPDERVEREIHDNGEYLIRPFLEPSERIRFKYNCERVVGLDKHDGIFLIGDLRLYVIENFYIDDSGCICEKESETELSVIDQALGVKKDITGVDFQLKSTSSWGSTVKTLVGGRAWAYSGGAWGKEKACKSSNMPHPWHMWKLDGIHELLKRDYQLRPVAIEIFSMDGCNDLLVFHKREREEVFKTLVAMNLPRNSMLDTTISGTSRQESNEGSRLFKLMAKSFSKRWQNGEITNFQYLMHLNTLAGRGYSDLTQYPVFPWVLADYESEELNLANPKSFRKLNKPMGCQTAEGEDEFRKRYESWDDPDVPKFHYGSHYSSAGIVLFYLLRLPPFSLENQKLQGGQFDHADRLFNSVRDTWLSAAGKGNTSDVKELIPEFFYLPEFLLNRFNLDLGEKQSGEKVGDVALPPWAKGSAREFIRKHREALESDYVSENLHHWIDLIFGYKQRGKAAEEAVNVFYHYTYEGSVDIDAVADPAMKASILAQINHFGQTPKQLFFKPHAKRRSDRRPPPHPLRHCADLSPYELRAAGSGAAVSQIVVSASDKILLAGPSSLLKPASFSTYLAWGFPDRSLRVLSYDQDRLLATHEGLHGGDQIQCAAVTLDGATLATGAADGAVAVWKMARDGPKSGPSRLRLEQALCAHTARIVCLAISQPYSLIASGSEDRTVILWDLSSLSFVKQLPEFPAPLTALHVNDLTGDVATAAGVLLAVWSVNGDCLAAVNASQLPSDSILCVSSAVFSDWQDTNWLVTGHQSGAVKVWMMAHSRSAACPPGEDGPSPEYRLLLKRVLRAHQHPVTAVHVTADLKQLLTGDASGRLLSWALPEE
ncbi:BEACH-DOMAIN HOMOLOG A1 isoform X2 [Wolffia australiana]